MRGSTPGNIWAALNEAQVDGSKVGGIQSLAHLGTDDFRVLDVHRGGMAEVFICEPRSRKAEGAGIPFALKTFKKKFFLDSTTRIAFLQESATWARLTGCLQIMPITGSAEIDGRPAIRMFAVQPEDGKPSTVAQMLHDVAPPPDVALDIALQIAMGMREASCRIPGIVHGDLKPGNLLVSGGSVWISDFGLARVYDPQRGALPLDSTLSYQAPEVFDDPGAATPKSDIYSFGILLYELLTGRCPVNAIDRETAEEAHRNLRLSVLGIAALEDISPAPGSSANLLEALSKIAIQCASFVPADRPADFATVLGALHQIAEQHDPVRHLERMMLWRRMKTALEDVRRVTAPQLVQLLFDTDNHEFALDLLEDLGVETLSSELARLYGASLVLTRRVEEGLAVFERLLLRADLSSSLRRETEMEQALALKRLDRFEEAIAIFERLLVDADDVFLLKVVTNLATVYLDARDFRAAEKLLTPFCARHPDNFHGWVNLGFAKAWLGHAEEALEALDRAIALNPAIGDTYAMRAAVYMDLLNQPQLAYTTLDTAFDQGCESRPLAVRTVVSAMQTGRPKVASVILQSLKRRLKKQTFDEIQAEIDALIRDLKDGTPRAEPRYRFFLRRARPRDISPAIEPSPLDDAG